MTDHDSRFSRRGFLGGLGATLAAGAAGLLGRRRDHVDLADVRIVEAGDVGDVPALIASLDSGIVVGELRGPHGLRLPVLDYFPQTHIPTELFPTGYSDLRFRVSVEWKEADRLLALLRGGRMHGWTAIYGNQRGDFSAVVVKHDLHCGPGMPMTCSVTLRRLGAA